MLRPDEDAILRVQDTIQCERLTRIGYMRYMYSQPFTQPARDAAISLMYSLDTCKNTTDLKLRVTFRLLDSPDRKPSLVNMYVLDEHYSFKA